MITGPDIATALVELGVTDVVWLPDSAIGPWESALEAHDALRLVRVCREGEAWTIAAGLALGGRQPLVMIQTTGLFESGDALRNVLFDLRLPIYSLIGYRSYLVPNSPDSARKFAEPILKTWGIDYLVIGETPDLSSFKSHFIRCRDAHVPGAALLAEGRM